MKSGRNLLAIGRSGYLYNTIRHLDSIGYKFKAIITDEAYDEYAVKISDFKELAEKLNAAFYVTKVLSFDLFNSLIHEHHIQIAISANWRFTIPETILKLFDVGILNYHLGNLPDYKGNATVNWSIMKGEKSIYANVHKMDAMLDAGDVISRTAIPIGDNTYISDIISEAERIAPVLYEEAIKKILINPNDIEVAGTTHGLRCYPRLPEDSQINWNLSAFEIARLIRASSHPYRGAFTFLDKQKVTVWKAKVVREQNRFCAMPGQILEVKKSNNTITVACSQGLLEIEEIEYGCPDLAAGNLIKSIRQRFKYLAG